MNTLETHFVIQRLAPITQYQDLGRLGHLHEGFSHSGPMDELAFAINNQLLGNPPNATQLEIALGGLQLKCLANCTIAISGAYAKPTLNGRPLVNFCAASITAGDVLAFGFAQIGVFSYLAIAGGFSPEPFLGSRATTKRLHIFPDGKALGVGSYLSAPATVHTKLQGAPRESLPDYRHSELTVIPAFQYQQFESVARDGLVNQSFKVASGDRMGSRLIAQKPIQWTGGELLSEGLLPGAIQIPPDGNPIILQRDAQSIGGYPKIGRLTTQARMLLAQKQPGETVTFCWLKSYSEIV
ncbi:MAG: allophanate hydrolase [Gammaproteobacteria bacterium]|nr:MAG: allophanate hydrolase [Gammaproteobacteria bacterium]